jgi:uncharacterized protein
LPEATSEKIERFLTRRRTAPLAISHWTRVEFSSALAREVRIGSLSRKAAIEAESQFAETTAESFVILLPAAGDFDLAAEFLREYETGLRAGDAFHLAIASNNRASAIYSLDKTFLAAGRRLDLKVTAGIRLGK